ncbi:dihydrofolate reductase [Isoptericola sediminis]|uniref:dihydrofolate reductase n=1 Tax=Isoptericola sediminis TaxID=2733572 RepID=A0A849K2Y4_9MICO|nr:dihydrofolate reductase [Isoptericola sediminis]
MIGLIWAQARDAAGRPVIGADGGIPWHVTEDFAHFQRTTSGHPVVMGRLTWQSLPDRVRPLPRRTNVVVTRGAAADVVALAVAERRADLTVAGSVEEALAAAAAAPGGDEVWVMGGSQVYADALALADRLVVTEVDLEVAGDAFAPDVDPGVWELVAEPADTGADDEGWVASSGTDGLRYRICTYRRRAVVPSVTGSHPRGTTA